MFLLSRKLTGYRQLLAERKKSVFVYPITKESFRQGGNNYIVNLVLHLQKDFNIVNKETRLGLLDVLLKIHKSDIIYFNWVEDIPDRRFGLLQVPLLIILLLV